MKHTLKFTGEFKSLKKQGYEHLKLFANNYKVYRKKLKKSFDIWVWVAQGGYIEINDLYSNTKNFIEAVKSINWAEVEERTFFTSNEPYKRVLVRLNHDDPSKGYKIVNESFDIELIKTLPKKLNMAIASGSNSKKVWAEHEKYHKKIRSEYDREIVVFEDAAKELLAELERIQK